LAPSNPSRKIDHLGSIPFYAMHAGCLLALWTGASAKSLAVCALLYWLRIFSITAGLHRLLAHASFKTTRWFQFLLAWCATMSVQKGPLWWASIHRHHHAKSDEPEDAHSPVQDGFFHSHLGWILSRQWETTLWKLIPDLARFPELRWLNRYHVLPGLLMGAACFLYGGFQTFVWGFFVSTVLVYHSTFMINSLAHVFGSRRYRTRDDSRNNFTMALFTMGEGWHNNHHFAPNSSRLGFFWWEIDIAYYILKALSWTGVVWDLKKPPRRAYEPQPDTAAEAA
jgi:stearoyl-CoA desaturase (delta-9 desaturase)